VLLPFKIAARGFGFIRRFGFTVLVLARSAARGKPLTCIKRPSARAPYLP